MGSTKKMFKHGGSCAVDLPVEFIKKINTDRVLVEITVDKTGFPAVIITARHEFDTMEADPLFAAFVQALYADALKNPDKLKDVEDVWGKRADRLLKGVVVEPDEE